MNITRGQTALITGASKGIGVNIARTLASKGMNLVLAARSVSELAAVRNEVEGLGVRAIAAPTDVADDKALADLVDRAMSEFGAIDVLMNNAGIERVMTYERVSLDDIEQMLQGQSTGADDAHPPSPSRHAQAQQRSYCQYVLGRRRRAYVFY